MKIYLYKQYKKTGQQFTYSKLTIQPYILYILFVLILYLIH